MLSRAIFHRNRLRNSLLSTRVKAWRIHHGDPSAGGEGKHSGGWALQPSWFHRLFINIPWLCSPADLANAAYLRCRLRYIFVCDAA